MKVTEFVFEFSFFLFRLDCKYLALIINHFIYAIFKVHLIIFIFFRAIETLIIIIIIVIKLKLKLRVF